jgi:hypothetical protein
MRQELFEKASAGHVVRRSPSVESFAVGFRQAKVCEDFWLVHLANLRVFATHVKQILENR